MKLENVFYGFTKDGERKLLWKRFKLEETSMGDVGRTIFFDLEKKEYIETNEIDETTLVPVVKLVGDVHRMSKRKVIKTYKADNELLFDATGAFYGNIVRKTTNYDLKSQNVLFVRVADPDGKVESLKSGKRYPWYNRVEKGLSVEEIRPINKELFDEAVVTKKKLLEADYKKEL